MGLFSFAQSNDEKGRDRNPRYSRRKADGRSGSVCCFFRIHSVPAIPGVSNIKQWSEQY